MMYKIEIETIDRLNELFLKVRTFSFLITLINEYKENSLSDDEKTFIRNTEYFLIEENYNYVEKLTDVINSDCFIKNIC